MTMEVRTEATSGERSRWLGQERQDPSLDLVALLLVIKQGGGGRKEQLGEKSKRKAGCTETGRVDSQLAAGTHRVQTWTEGG